MASFEELPEYVKDKAVETLRDKVKNNPDYVDYSEEWIEETIDDWLNTHNFDLSNADWTNQAEQADI